MLQTYNFEFDPKVVARYAAAREKRGSGEAAVVKYSIGSFCAFMRHPLTTGPRKLDPDAFLAFGDYVLTGKFWPGEEVSARIGYVRDFLFDFWKRDGAPKPVAPTGLWTRDRIWAWQQFETSVVTNQCDLADQSLVDAFLRKKEQQDGNARRTLANIRSVLESFRFLTGVPFRDLTGDLVRDFPWQHRNHRNAVRQMIGFGHSTNALPESTVLSALRSRESEDGWGGPFERFPLHRFTVRSRIMTPPPVPAPPVIAIVKEPPGPPVPVPSVVPFLPVGNVTPERFRLPRLPRWRPAVMPASPSVPVPPPVPAIMPVTAPQIGMPLDPGIGVIRQGPILALIGDLHATVKQRFDQSDEKSDRLERLVLSLISSLAGPTIPQPGTFAASVEPAVAPTRETPPDPVPVAPVASVAPVADGAPGWVTLPEAMSINHKGSTWFWNRLNSGRIEWENVGTGVSPVVMIRNPLAHHPLGTFGSRFPIAPLPPADAVDADFVSVAQAECRMDWNRGKLRQYVEMGRITNRKRPDVPWEVYWPDEQDPPEPIQRLMAGTSRGLS